jgi:chromosome segregation ATPase
MAIASVVQGLIETEDGKVFELDSCKGSVWLESIGSFRYEPTGANKPYTVRQETKKGGDYWYGYRKVAGKLHKKYIGKSSELSTAKLEEIAEALNTSQQPRVTQVADTVTQVTQVTQVAEAVTDSHTAERVTALELQVQALRESLEALRSELLGKPEGLGNFSELPNPCKVTGSELQIELGNLKTELSNLATENEKLRADYDALLESSTVVADNLRREVRELQVRLEVERVDRGEVEAHLADREKQIEELRSQLAIQVERAPQHQLYSQIEELKERNRLLLIKSREERQKLEEKISALEYRGKSQSRRLEEKQARLDELEVLLEGELSDLKQKSVAASKDLPEAADLLNQLKSKRKKSKADLADLEAILEILES